jgi:Cu(I)/Ag(I) efflux system protein CusF
MDCYNSVDIRLIHKQVLEVRSLNKQPIRGFLQTLIFLPLLVGNTASSGAESPSVLDPGQHPDSPEYESILNENIIPLDAKLSWKARFNGDESFNPRQAMPQNGSSLKPASDSMVMNSESKSAMKMDVQGTVKSIRTSQGKIKIKHGPIDKYGMPGMTMMFKVADPSLLNGLEKGSRIDFNVDNSGGGFVITDIVPVKE